MMVRRPVFSPQSLLLALATSILDVESLSSSPSSKTKIRAISFDVTGTLVTTREPVVKSYYDAAIWSRLPNPPSQDDLKAGFKVAFKERCIDSPCYGGVEGISGRDWWKETVRRVLDHAMSSNNNNSTGSSSYSDDDFDRYFRRVYQHFGSPNGYRVLEDADEFVKSLVNTATDDDTEKTDFLLGITSNTPTRHMETVLPMLNNFHDNFQWFSCSQDVGAEKPAKHIFDDAFRQAKYWIPDLARHEVLHIGDSLACDYCGAKAYGFQALLLDRSEQHIPQYQDCMDAPDYPGKSEDDISRHTIKNLLEVNDFLTSSQ